MSLKSGSKVAAYLYKPKGKLYDFNEMVKYTELKAKEVEVEIDEFYADGWDDIPNGIDELISDAGNYGGILLYSLEGITTIHLNGLSTTNVYCITTPWITGRAAATDMANVIKAGDYYKTMRSLNIRMGIKASSKHSGNVPYGYVVKDGLLVEQIEEKKNLDNILAWKKNGMTVSEIAKKTGLETWKIYGILNYWRNKQ